MQVRYRPVSVFALVLALAVAPAALATNFLSIDVTTDELVNIDSSTGTVTTIGPVGYNFSNSQLAVLNGSLYAINTPGGTAAAVPFVQINPSTGAAIAITTLKSGATTLVLTAADGFTSDGTTLLVSYSSNAGAPFSSHTLADVSTTGQLTNGTVFPTTRDMDNIAAMSGGGIYAIDGVVVSPNNRVDTYNVARPSTYTLLGAFFVTGSDGHTGAVFDDMGNLWAWRRGTRTLDRISTATGALLASVSITTTRNLRGLALAPEAPVKTESKTWGGVKALYR